MEYKIPDTTKIFLIRLQETPGQWVSGEELRRILGGVSKPIPTRHFKRLLDKGYPVESSRAGKDTGYRLVVEGDATNSKKVVTIPENSKIKPGRPKAINPTDNEPLIAAIHEAQQQGKPLYKTGRKGAYRQRDMLPPEFRSIGRDRVERLIDGLLSSGQIKHDEDGALCVPENYVQ